MAPSRLPDFKLCDGQCLWPTLPIALPYQPFAYRKYLRALVEMTMVQYTQ